MPTCSSGSCASMAARVRKIKKSKKKPATRMAPISAANGSIIDLPLSSGAGGSKVIMPPWVPQAQMAMGASPPGSRRSSVGGSPPGSRRSSVSEPLEEQKEALNVDDAGNVIQRRPSESTNEVPNRENETLVARAKRRAVPKKQKGVVDLPLRVRTTKRTRR